MSQAANRIDRELAHLRKGVSLSLAVAEVAVEALSESLERGSGSITAEAKAETQRAIRALRIGIIKQRAVMGAFRINV